MIWFFAEHSFPLPMQGERDRFAFSKQELEKSMSKMTDHIEVLGKQLNEKVEKCQFLEVPSSHTH